MKFGFTPLISASVSNVNSLRYNLNLGKGILLSDSVICDWEGPDIRKIEFPGLVSYGLILAWRSSNNNQLLSWSI